eukprot:6235727-Ditylum_brightwellii.AAC.2
MQLVHGSTKIDKITTGAKIIRSYKAISSENTKDDAAAYKNNFKSQNNPIDVDAEHIDSKEDNLGNCWREPP